MHEMTGNATEHDNLGNSVENVIEMCPQAPICEWTWDDLTTKLKARRFEDIPESNEPNDWSYENEWLLTHEIIISPSSHDPTLSDSVSIEKV